MNNLDLMKALGELPESYFSECMPQQKPVRQHHLLPAAAIAACFGITIGIGCLFRSQDGVTEARNPSYDLQEVTCTQTSAQTVSAIAAQTQTASVITETDKITACTGITDAVTEQTDKLPAPPETVTEAFTPAETAPPAADTLSATETITTVQTTAAADDGIPTIDIPDGGVYVLRDMLSNEDLPHEVRISALPDAVFTVIEDDGTAGSITVRYSGETQVLSEGVYLSRDHVPESGGIYLVRAVFADISGDGVPELCMTACAVPTQVIFTVVFEPVERKLYSMGEIGDISTGGWEMFEVAVDSGKLGGIRRTYYPPEERENPHDNAKAYGTFRILDGILYFIEDRTGTQYH